MTSPYRVLVVAAAACAAALSVGCRKARPGDGSAASASAGASAVPLDRLAPGELPPGTEEIYGLVLPRGMKVAGRFPGVGHAAGPLPPEDVANYIRARVDVKRVELGAVGTVFPTVRVLRGDPTKAYRIEVTSAGKGTTLKVSDVTPVPKKTPEPGLSEAERWKRAGYNPNGTPVNEKELR